jgi:hypothetical protein
MQPGQQFHDDPMNLYGWWLQQRDENLCRSNPERKPTQFYSTYFFNQLFDARNGGAYNYSQVARYSATQLTRTEGNVFKLERLVAFVHCPGHWFLCVAHIQKRRIEIYDSLVESGHRKRYSNGMVCYLKDEAKKWKGDPSVAHLLDVGAWAVVDSIGEVKKLTPQQDNNYDCGPFALMTADYLSQGLEPRFTQNDIERIRVRITLTILDEHDRHRLSLTTKVRSIVPNGFFDTAVTAAPAPFAVVAATCPTTATTPALKTTGAHQPVHQVLKSPENAKGKGASTQTEKHTTTLSDHHSTGTPRLRSAKRNSAKPQ